MPAKSTSKSGMQGVYLVAAELTGKGFIVSVTSRNAYGADILVTDQDCQNAWSVQVKTNSGRNTFWLMNRRAQVHRSPSHVYVFVNLRRGEPTEYFIIRSAEVANHIYVDRTANGEWYSFDISDARAHLNAWDVFGNPEPAPKL